MVMMFVMAEPGPVAPEPLELVRRFVNTRDIEAGRDRFASVDGLRSWLREVHLLRTRDTATAAQLRHAIAVREAVRGLLRTNHGHAPLSTSSLRALDEAAEGLSVSFTPTGGWTVRPLRGGVDGALGRLLAVAIEAMAEGTWRRLKVCTNDACEWAFYDRSRAGSGKWCYMSICGNRAKQQTWRAKRTS